MKLTAPDKVYQYDINQRVSVSGIDIVSQWQAHFAKTGSETALVLEIHETNGEYWAYIPNQLVELGAMIYCYLYNVTEDKAYTDCAISIPIIGRPKPDDYISEPTDVLTWGQLRADIGTLSQLATEDKTNLVEAVNELHRDIETAKTEQDKDIAAIRSDINEINQLIDYINDIDNEQSQAIVKIQSDTTSLKNKTQSQDEAIREIEQTVDEGFEQIQTELDKKQPKGDYITNAVDNLVNYYLKSETYTQSEVNNLVSSLTHINIKVVSSIDDVTEPNVIYLVPVIGGKSDDYYNEYILVNGSPELIGNTRVDLSDYYTREQTNDLLNDKQPIGNYATSVNGTTPDKNGNINIDVQTYTAGEGISIDEGAISVTNPMDDAQVSETTTWSSAKIISSVSQSFSQSGSIVTCQPVEGSPLHVVSDITAVQEGTGDPSPDNVRPIVGWNGANLIRCGTNLWPDYIVSQTYANGNTVTVNDGWIDVHKVAGASINQAQTGIFLPLSTYTLSNGIDTGSSVYFQVDNALYTMTYPTHTDELLLRDAVIYIYSSTDAIADVSLRPSLNVGSSVLPYEPYRGQTYTADFGEIVYGGTLDWATGVLTVDSVLYQFTGNESINQSSNTTESAYCVFIANISPSPVTFQYADMSNSYFSHGSVSTVRTMSSEDNTFAYNENLFPFIKVQKTKIPNWDEQADTTQKVALMTNYIKSQYQAGTPLTVCYTIEPYTIQLTPAQILAISGLNTVYCDTGDVTVTGYEDPRTTIANLSARIAALESAATGV